MKIEKLILMVMLFWMGLLSHAQTNRTLEKPFRVRLLSWGETVHDLPLYSKNGEEFEELFIRSNRRSEPLSVDSNRLFRVYTDGENSEGLPIKVQVSETQIPPEMKEPLLILFDSGVDGANRFRTLVIEDDVTAFPFGTYKIFNLSKASMVIVIDEDTVTLAPGNSGLAETSTNDRVNIPVKIAARVDGSPKMLKTSIWRHKPSQRVMIFIFESQESGSRDFIIRTISERETTYLNLYEELSE